MKTYSHDYTLPAKAMRLLYRAFYASRRGCAGEAESLILSARYILNAYLSCDNMVPDDDVADGWVKLSDVDNEIHNDH